MKKVVIIGGGFAGAYAAKKLEHKFEVTLIDEKDYFEFTPSVLRTLVDPSHVKKIQVLHSHYLHKAHLIKGKVKSIADKKVTLENSEVVSFDYLIVSSGSRYNTPIKDKDLIITTRARDLRSYSQQLREAKKILIIGGGVVGVELAAEIAETYPEKKITIIHSKENLIDRNPPRMRAYVKDHLEKAGVKLIFNQVVEGKNAQGLYTTNTGQTLASDMTFLCIGTIPNFEHLGICSTQLNDRKRLCVNDFLQVQGYKHIFAAGDVTDIKEEKTAQAAEKQAHTVVENICALDKGRRLKTYSPDPKVMVISLGKKKGLLIHQNISITGTFPAFLKRFIEWKSMRRYR